MKRPLKAYKNLEFLNSPAGRLIRIICELTEPKDRLRKYRIRNTIVFFGSARACMSPDFESNDRNDKVRGVKTDVIDTVPQGTNILSQYYDDAVKLSEKLTKWSSEIKNARDHFFICSGGGPGIMEAANRGAAKAGGRSIGLNISLPFEQNVNSYQTKELAFEFHYFFVRKFWFFYLAKAIVVFPGGFGTFDEFFELITLAQTKKFKKYIPIVLYGSDYWNEIVNFEAMVKWGTISSEDLQLFRIIDDVNGAFEFLTTELTDTYLKTR